MAQYCLLAETHTSAGAGSESLAYSYNTHADVMANNFSSSSWTGLNWGADWHTAELAYDGKYRLFGERSTSAGAGEESVIYTYDTYADLVAGNYSSWNYTQFNWSSGWRTVGFEFDGKYRIMGETNTQAAAGFESTVFTYNTFADLIANQWSDFQNTQIDWIPEFHTAGIAYDGNKYRLMCETTTQLPGSESAIYTFDTWNDLVNLNYNTWFYTLRNLDPAFHTAGYTYQPVPEPATIAALGLGIAAVIRRRKGR